MFALFGDLVEKSPPIVVWHDRLLGDSLRAAGQSCYTSSMSTTAPSHEAEILARTIRPGNADLSEDAGASLLGWKLTDSDRDRVNYLAAKCRQDTLTEEERSELDEYERVASLLELVQSKARLSLKRAGLSP